MAFWPFSPDPEYKAAWEAHADQVNDGEDSTETSQQLDEAAERTPFWRKVW